MEGRAPLEGPLALFVMFYLTKPKSRRKKDIYPDVNPDIDNYIKALFDALQGVVFDNDKRICLLTVQKVYADYQPHTYVEISSLGKGGE